MSKHLCYRHGQGSARGAWDCPRLFLGHGMGGKAGLKCWEFNGDKKNGVGPFSLCLPHVPHSQSPLGESVCTLCELRGLGHVGQAELAPLPAAVVADEGVVGLLDVDVVPHAEHVTGCLQHTQALRHLPDPGLAHLTCRKSPQQCSIRGQGQPSGCSPSQIFGMAQEFNTLVTFWWSA